MNYLIEILFKFEGTIGALLGVATTLIITDILRKRGKIKVYVMKHEGKFRTYETAGCRSALKKTSDLYNYGFNFVVHIYNGTDVYKSYRNFTVQLIENDEIIKELNPYHDNLIECSRIYFDEDLVNVVPKSVEKVSISGNVDRNDVDAITNVNKVVLQYYDEKDRKKELLISNKLTN